MSMGVTVHAAPSPAGTCGGTCGSCGVEDGLLVFEGATLGSYAYVGGAVDSSTSLADYSFTFSPAARYVVVCRPAEGCGADDLNVDLVRSIGCL